jgi:hypothetical protein
LSPGAYQTWDLRELQLIVDACVDVAANNDLAVRRFHGDVLF